MQEFKPLSGLKVIETANVLAGPSVGMFLAELGAEVIKIENPVQGGDMTRAWKLNSEDPDSSISAYFSSVNYGKLYLKKDLSNKDDRKEVLAMIEDADILVNNMKLTSAMKFGLDYESLSKSNPRLIHAELTGFAGANTKVGFDIVLQAETGYLSMTGEPANPAKLPVALIDIIAAHQMKEGILLSLYQRERDGKGAHILCSLEEASLSSLANQATNYLMESFVPGRMGSLHPNIAPYGEIVRTSDHAEFVLAIGSEPQFERFCQLLGKAEWVDDERFMDNQCRLTNRSVLDGKMKKAVQGISADEFENACERLNIPVGKIKSLDEVLESEVAQGMVREEKIEGHPTRRLSSLAFKITR